MNCDVTMYGLGTLYGVDSAPEEQTALQLDLRPVLALKARVALIRDVPKGSIPAMDEPSKPNGTAGSRICRLAMQMACRGVYPMGERMCGSENLQLPLLGASVWISLRWILPMHLGLLSEILLRWSITGKTAGFLPLVLQSKQEASAISC